MRTPWSAGTVDFDGSSCEIMGIVNLTPDSFFDGGKHNEPRAAFDHARSLVDAGARILDLGAASSRPGFEPVPVEEELRRLLPALELIAPMASERGVVLSVDTTSAEVARRAVERGVRIVNDIACLRADPEMERTAVELSKEFGAAIVLNHPGSAESPNDMPSLAASLVRRAEELEARGVERSRVLLDPGIGFGKTAEENYDLLAALDSLCATGYPVLVGVSRKSLFGKTPGLENSDRLVPSVAVHLLSACAGAGVVRVHDVAATREALDVLAMFERRTSVRSPFFRER